MTGWSVEFSADFTQVRAVVNGVETKWRPATPTERAILADPPDENRSIVIARSFFLTPEQLEGEGGPVAEWLGR